MRMHLGLFSFGTLVCLFEQEAIDRNRAGAGAPEDKIEVLLPYGCPEQFGCECIESIPASGLWRDFDSRE